jgi:hypothetical protein
MNHGSIMGLSVDKNVATRVTHESTAKATAKLSCPLSANHSTPFHVPMALTMVEATILWCKFEYKVHYSKQKVPPNIWQ